MTRRGLLQLAIYGLLATLTGCRLRLAGPSHRTEPRTTKLYFSDGTQFEFTDGQSCEFTGG